MILNFIYKKSVNNESFLKKDKETCNQCIKLHCKATIIKIESHRIYMPVHKDTQLMTNKFQISMERILFNIWSRNNYLII